MSLILTTLLGELSVVALTKKILDCAIGKVTDAGLGRAADFANNKFKNFTSENLPINHDLQKAVLTSHWSATKILTERLIDSFRKTTSVSLPVDFLVFISKECSLKIEQYSDKNHKLLVETPDTHKANYLIKAADGLNTSQEFIDAVIDFHILELQSIHSDTRKHPSFKNLIKAIKDGFENLNWFDLMVAILNEILKKENDAREAFRNQNLAGISLSQEEINWKLDSGLATLKTHIDDSLRENELLLFNQLTNNFKEILDVRISSTEDFLGGKIDSNALQLERIIKEIEQISQKLPEKSKVKKSNLYDKYLGFTIGREEEFSQLKTKLLIESRKIVGLFGIGGIGKSRLAFEFARQNESYFNGGVWFIELMEKNSDPEFQQVVIESIGYSENAIPGHYLTYFLSLFDINKQYLIILDNYEQLVGIADESLNYWLKNTKNNVKFILTSTIHPNLQVQLCDISLGVLDKDNTWTNSLLFIEQKARYHTQGKLYYEGQIHLKENDNLLKLCETVQGIPLALEIISTRLGIKSAKQILLEITSIIELSNQNATKKQHDTLEATLNWSFDLLPLEMQKCFLAMATFRDGFDNRAASFILSNFYFNENNLVFLIENKLLEVAPSFRWTRYKLLNVILRFLSQKIDKTFSQTEMEKLLHAKVEYYLNYAKKYNNKLIGRDSSEAASILEIEFENYFYLQELLIEKGEINKSAEVILSLGKVLEMKSPSNLRIEKFRKSYVLMKEDSRLLLELSFNLSKAYLASGDWDMWIELLINCLRLSEEFGDFVINTHIYHSLHSFYQERGQPFRAKSFAYKALKFNSLGDNSESLNAQILASVGLNNFKCNNETEGLRDLKRAEKIISEKGNDFEMIVNLNRLALAMYFQGNLNEAIKLIKKTCELAQQTNNKVWLPAGLTNLALMLSEDGQYEEALKIFEKAHFMQIEVGRMHWQAVNYGGWGRTLLMTEEFQSDTQVRDTTFEYISRAIVASEKVFYPENLTMHLGDLARFYFFTGNYSDAFLHSLRAVGYSYKIKTNRGKRYFSNLTILACSAFELGKEDKFYEAYEIIEKMKLDKSFEIYQSLPKIVQDISFLEKYSEKFNFSIRKKVVEYFDRMDISTQSRKTVRNNLDSLAGQNRYDYPWYFLKEDLAKDNKKYINIFGYGSLLNEKSALRTVSKENFTNAIRAIAFGARRVFNYQMPSVVSSRSVYEDVDIPQDYSCLNILITGLVSDFCNGLIIKIPVDGIDGLCKREVGYDLIEVPCLTWDDKLPFGEKVFILSAEDRYYEGRKLVNYDIKPHPTYLNDCILGAKDFGDKFYEFWASTTYASDMVSLLENT